MALLYYIVDTSIVVYYVLYSLSSVDEIPHTLLHIRPKLIYECALYAPKMNIMSIPRHIYHILYS